MVNSSSSDNLKSTLARLKSIRDRMMKKRAKVPGTNVSAAKMARYRATKGSKVC